MPGLWGGSGPGRPGPGGVPGLGVPGLGVPGLGVPGPGGGLVRAGSGLGGSAPRGWYPSMH